jgi:hypothetical protein
MTYFKPIQSFKDFGKRKWTQTSVHDHFIAKSLFVWGVSMLQNQKEPIEKREQTITCTCPAHGDFSITARAHIESSMSGGCPFCINDWVSDERRTSPEKLNKIKEDIEQVFELMEEFAPKNVNASYRVRCKTCFHETSLCISNFVYKNNGCKKCSGKKLSKQYAMGLEAFIERAVEIHGDLFDYSKVTEYVNNREKVEVVCKKHGSFFVSPANHLHRNSGCPVCRGEKFYGTYEGDISLYFIECYKESERFVKVGITKNLKQRFRQFPYDYHPLMVMTGDFKTLLDVEQRLHYYRNFKKHRPLIPFNGGENECYAIEDKPKLVDYLTSIVSSVQSYKCVETDFEG